MLLLFQSPHFFFVDILPRFRVNRNDLPLKGATGNIFFLLTSKYINSKEILNFEICPSPSCYRFSFIESNPLY
jgi:hypothetical protein